MFNLFTSEVYYIIAGALLVLDLVLALRAVQVLIAKYRCRKANKAETETENETLSKDEMTTNIIRRYGYEDNATIVFCEVCDLCTTEACTEIYNDLIATYGEANA